MNTVIVAHTTDHRRIVIALTDEPFLIGVIKVGDDPNLVVAHVRPITTLEGASALAHTALVATEA